jgi:sugar O-acyltransferase (sialic acid O-acetyltransferase NeuD family)
MEKVILFGNQSIARETFAYLKYHSDHTVVAFTVDEDYVESDSLLGVPVIGFDAVAAAFPPDQHRMLIAVGYVQNNKVRAERYARAKDMGYQLMNFVCPTSVVYPGNLEGDNCIIGHCTVIASAAKIGNDVFIESGCTIGHDVVVGDHCFFSNGVSVAGGVRIGPYCYVGANATIRNNVSIGSESVIGAGAIILENTEERSVYLGEPATLLPISSDQLSLG